MILNQLASAQNRNDEKPNIVLAEKIAKSNDAKAVQELVAHLTDKGTAIPNDCIKVLYEVGDRKPKLIAKHLDTFVALLTHKNNRLQWGAMTALHCISRVDPKGIYTQRAKILVAANSGSVITRDYAVNILIELASVKQFSKEAFKLLLDQLKTSPDNQLPMYAERAMTIVNVANQKDFLRVLQARVGNVKPLSKQKRVEKVIKKIAVLNT